MVTCYQKWQRQDDRSAESATGCTKYLSIPQKGETKLNFPFIPKEAQTYYLGLGGDHVYNPLLLQTGPTSCAQPSIIDNYFTFDLEKRNTNNLS